ncbi:hypothetical protein U9M48_035154 [Paspalum notatum var. saurae]|uniref:F-box domain-containing protein n=1 Tax=Paspalum notatum var. saurae TaxID=547442 RepID=A0AAQ3X8P9_PASNO
MEEGSRRVAAAAAAVLPEELVVEILARLPAKSICRFKCVSRAWRALISDPANRRRLAQPLSGIFFSRSAGSLPPWGFAGLPTPPPPGVDTALSFLPDTCGEMELLDSCNGLLLLRCNDARGSPAPPPFYAVCNPATAEWVALPPPSRTPGRSEYFAEFDARLNTCVAALGFDPAVSSHFHVFQVVQELHYYDFIFKAVEIYSSETGRWVFRVGIWDENDDIRITGQMTYFNGFLHLCTVSNAVVSVDTEGQAWRLSRVMQNATYRSYSLICHSQGRLVYVYDNMLYDTSVSIYVLEDHDSEKWMWIFKESINKLDLFGPWTEGWSYYTAAFHPDSDLVFFYDRPQKRLMSYDMRNKDVQIVCNIGEVHGEYFNQRQPFLPYVPLYSGLTFQSPRHAQWAAAPDRRRDLHGLCLHHSRPRASAATSTARAGVRRRDFQGLRSRPPPPTAAAIIKEGGSTYARTAAASVHGSRNRNNQDLHCIVTNRISS